ncbi:hypothetical protein E4T56_gene5334 [Termitomyces sp. T112]|nr:hypothetical protein E4T56_gene5334 [Termitomyces sp. T112]
MEGIVCVYLDNILIYTKMLEEHYQITCLILEHFHQHQLYFKPEKCKFEQTWIEYLGLIIFHRAAEMDLVKVAGVAGWPEPKNKKEDFLHHAHPLFDLTSKDIVWSWVPPEQMAFNALECTVTSGPILLFPDDDFPFQVEVNSYNFVTGAVLSQESLEDRKRHLVAFYFKSLSTVEQNYKIYDKEMLAIIWSFKEWWHFLEGHSTSLSQTKHVNQELEQYLCLFYNEHWDDWDELLPNAKFQYNNYIHAFTQFSPFFLDTR